MQLGSIVLALAMLAGATPAYRLTRTGGEVVYIVSYVKKGQFYHVTDGRGKVTQHFVGSVKSIEPLTEQEAKLAEGGTGADAAPDLGSSAGSADIPYDLPSARTTARYTPRTTSRTTARTGARRSYSLDDPLPALDLSASNIGTTATGIPLHMGPRGGIYHYSKSGNKVYQRKK